MNSAPNSQSAPKPPVKGKVMPFPVDSLKDSLDLVSKIVSTRGGQVSTQKEISIATGIGDGTLPLPLSTAVQYGLLESQYGSGYRVTDAYSQITSAIFPHLSDEAKYEALRRPPLYDKILNEFNGKFFPDQKGFENYLIKLQFKPYSIPKIIRAFFQNFGEHIDANGKLRFMPPLQNEKKPESMIVDVEPVVEKRVLIPNTKPTELEGNFQQPIPLPGGKMAVLEYPKGNMSSDDFTALKAFIAYLELSEGLTGKKKENE